MLKTFIEYSFKSTKTPTMRKSHSFKTRFPDAIYKTKREDLLIPLYMAAIDVPTYQNAPPTHLVGLRCNTHSLSEHWNK